MAVLSGTCLGLVILYYQLLTWPVFCIKDIRNIEITGLRRLSREEVLKLAHLGPQTNLLALRPGVVEQALRAHPWIAQAELTRKWPNRLILHLSEREPVALVPLDELYYLDRQGSLFKSAAPGDPHDFPVITGLGLEHFTTGMPGNNLVKQTLALLELLKEGPPAFQVNRVAEIHVDSERGYTLYVNGLKTAFDLGFEELPQKIQKLATVWPELVKRGYLARAQRVSLNHPQRLLVSFRDPEAAN
jgi:cell division protein FtsQ